MSYQYLEYWKYTVYPDTVTSMCEHEPLPLEKFFTFPTEKKSRQTWVLLLALSASTELTAGALAAGTAPLIRVVTCAILVGRILTLRLGRGRPLKFLVW